jgi:hypothetical protein
MLNFNSQQMKTYFNILKVTCLALVILTGACKKVVDLQPTDLIETSKAFQSVDDLEKGTIAAYSGYTYEFDIYIASIMADDVRWALDNNTRNFGVAHKWSFDGTNGDAIAAWANSYTVIDRINRVLAAAGNITAANTTQVATKARIMGELLALRGFYHFQLLKSYASKYEASGLGIPYMTTSEIFGKPARKTFGEVMTLVKKDLVDAKALIPADYAVADFSRITRIAVSAIQARVALYNKDWDDAITYSSEVIAARPLASRTVFPSIWTDASTTEVVFRLNRAATTVNNLWIDTNNDVFFSPSNKLISTFDQTNDIRYSTYIRFDNTVAANKEQWKVNKYPGQTTVIRYNHTKVFRTAEMYLIRSEAYALRTAPDLLLSAADLNTLRTARITGYVPVVFASAAAALTQIDLERFKELAFEGHRFFDIRRRNVAVVRNDNDITTGTSIPKTLNITDRNYTLPISQAEVFANPNILPNNPGY